MDSANLKSPLRLDGSMPGQKSIRLAKKGGDPSLSGTGFRRFSPGIPYPRVTSRIQRRENWEGFSRPFWLRRLLFCPGNKETGLKDQRKLEIIHNLRCLNSPRFVPHPGGGNFIFISVGYLFLRGERG